MRARTTSSPPKTTDSTSIQHSKHQSNRLRVPEIDQIRSNIPKYLPSLSRNLNQFSETREVNPPSDSCPELQNGYRLQTRAYERCLGSPSLSPKQQNQNKLSNCYVDRLKQFFQADNEKEKVQGGASIPHSSKTSSSPPKQRNEYNTMSVGDNMLMPSSLKQLKNLTQSRDNEAAEKSQGSVNKRKSSTNVTIILTSPNGKISTSDDDLFYNLKSRDKQSRVRPIQPAHGHSSNSQKQEGKFSKLQISDDKIQRYFPFLSPRIPPPAPILLPAGQRNQALLDQNETKTSGGYDGSSSSLSSTDNEILKAVQNLGSEGSSTRSKTQQLLRKRRLNRAALERNPKNVAMKMSLPCRAGCCYCVYASLLGPVKIFLTRGEKPKQEPWLTGIRDGNGRPAIPVSRKEDITGLVYDANNHSFYPPTKGQRPLFPASTGSVRIVRTNASSKVKSAAKK